MTAALLLVCACTVPSQGDVVGEAWFALASDDAATAEAFEPGPVLIGEPLRLVVTLDGRGAEGAALDEKAFDLGYAWSVVDGPAATIDASTPANERPAVRLAWTLLALEPGAVETPPIPFTLADGSSHAVAPAAIEVLPALEEGEDAPRPMRGYRDVEDRRLGDPRLVVLALLGLLALPLAALGIVRLRRRPAVAPAAPLPTPRERIEALDPAVDPRGAMSDLGPLVRAAVDAARGRDAGPATDEEWATSLLDDATVPEAARKDAAALVRELSVVRFGGSDPTSFAARDAVERALRLTREVEA
ncbi:MAG: hypothetical protein AAGB93_22370 [Planctomycetota bacterium]